MNLAYEPLFTPFSIRNTRIKNRYFMAAMGTVTHNDEDGATCRTPWTISSAAPPAASA